MPVPRQESEHHVFVHLKYRFCLFLRFRYLILELFRQCGIFFIFNFFMLHWNQRLREVFIYLNHLQIAPKVQIWKLFLLHHDELAQESLKKICLTSSLPSSLSWIFYSLVHWNNSPRIDMSPRSYTLSWFRANQSLPFFLNAACLAEKQQIPIL